MTRSEMQKQTIDNLVLRLRGGTGTSAEIAAMLQSEPMRLFLETWVVTPLLCLNDANDESRSTWQRAEDMRLARSMSGR